MPNDPSAPNAPVKKSLFSKYVNKVRDNLNNNTLSGGDTKKKEDKESKKDDMLQLVDNLNSWVKETNDAITNALGSAWSSGKNSTTNDSPADLNTDENNTTKDASHASDIDTNAGAQNNENNPQSLENLSASPENSSTPTPTPNSPSPNLNVELSTFPDTPSSNPKAGLNDLNDKKPEDEEQQQVQEAEVNSPPNMEM